jgi:sortase (surface protein transpeptidase)
VPVVASGLDRNGAVDTPFGPLGSAVWREGFWWNGGADPGALGTTSIAGHLDDTAGRPAAFWNVRNLQVGDEVDVTRSVDHYVVRYHVTEIDDLPTTVSNQASWLHRLYGTGVERAPTLTLVTCTGRYVHGEYDHRFLVFAQAVP